jgi:hypothetical protein
MAEVVYAKFNGWIGPYLFLRKGEPWAADADVVKQYPQHFTSEPGKALRGARPVETATAAPGETRDVTPPADDESQVKRGPGRPRKTS